MQGGYHTALFFLLFINKKSIGRKLKYRVDPLTQKF